MMQWDQLWSPPLWCHAKGYFRDQGGFLPILGLCALGVGVHRFTGTMVVVKKQPQMDERTTPKWVIEPPQAFFFWPLWTPVVVLSHWAVYRPL